MLSPSEIVVSRRGPAERPTTAILTDMPPPLEATPSTMAERFAPEGQKAPADDASRAQAKSTAMPILAAEQAHIPASNRWLLIVSLLVSLVPTAIILALIWQGAIRFPQTDALPIALVDAAEVLFLNADVLILGLFLPPELVGLYCINPARAGGVSRFVSLWTVHNELRRRHRAHRLGATTGAGTSASAVGMVACCAHHLADLVPLLGATGVAAFLFDWRVSFMLAGIGVNAIAIAIAARRLHRLGGHHHGEVTACAA